MNKPTISDSFINDMVEHAGKVYSQLRDYLWMLTNEELIRLRDLINEELNKRGKSN